MKDVKSEDINCQIIDMQIGIKEQVIQNHDGSYTILLNGRYATDTLMREYNHALRHIMNDDFSRDSVQQIEAEAHSCSI